MFHHERSHVMVYMTASSHSVSVLPQTQADGPHHWLANRRAPTGETLGRRRLLAARGWAVVSVPYFDWPSGGARDKQAYMRAVRCPPS